MNTRILLAALCLSACTGAPRSEGNWTDDGVYRVTEGSPAALGMIAFLNDSSTTVDLLDDQVGLDVRAARSIMAFRDNSAFDDVDEIDGCYYVGASALSRIETWATEHNWVALNDDDVLGTWDGVEFTLAQATSTLELANTGSFNYLDDNLGLDARAVRSIVEARPVESIQQLAGLYYVGRTALTTLRETAEGEPDCAVEGWEILYIYDEGDGAWRTTLPAGLVAVIDTTLENNSWCEDSVGQPAFIKATVDNFNCEPKGYTIELAQDMVEYPGVAWYIEFEVSEDFSWFLSTCEV